MRSVDGLCTNRQIESHTWPYSAERKRTHSNLIQKARTLVCMAFSLLFAACRSLLAIRCHTFATSLPLGMRPATVRCGATRARSVRSTLNSSLSIVTTQWNGWNGSLGMAHLRAPFERFERVRHFADDPFARLSSSS